MFPSFLRWFHLDWSNGFEDIGKCFLSAKSQRYTNRKAKPSMFGIIGLGKVDRKLMISVMVQNKPGLIGLVLST